MSDPVGSQFKIGSLIRKAESDYREGTVTLSAHVQFNLRENLEKIDAYSNSKHVSGTYDSYGRKKPFFNIVTSAINIWYRATDIDRRHIKLRATKLKDTVRAFIGTMMLQQWMRDTNFGAFLNKWGRSLVKHGSSVVKFVEKNGTLYPIVMDWQKLIVDPIAFDDAPVIEVLELTPAQLRKRKGYDQEQVKALISACKDVRETADGQNKDEKSEYIRVYEIHGELELSYITEDEKDKDTFVQQMHVVSFVQNKDGKYDDYTLAKGRESKHPYMITHLIEEDNRTLSIGVVEHLFESQWMTNHTAKQIKDHLDLASKLIFQTADDTFVGQNALVAIENGDILVHTDGSPLTQVNNSSHDITTNQSVGEQWKALGNEAVGVSEAMLGRQPKSGTAWRQTEALLSESHDLFELMTENKGLAIEEMMRKFVLPHIQKKMKNKDEVIGVLEDHDIRKIDARYIAVETQNRVKQEIINSLKGGELPLTLDVTAQEDAIKRELSKMGNTRSFVPSEVSNKDWQQYFEGFVWETEVDVTGEQQNAQEHITTMTTVLQTIASNPQALNDPNFKMLFSKILNLTGAISPLEVEDVEGAPVQNAPTAQPLETAGAINTDNQ